MRFCNRCGSPYPPKIYNFGLSQGVLTLSKNDVFNWMYALVMLVAVGSFWGALTSGLFVAFSTYFPYLGLSIGSWFVGLIVGCFSKQRWILLAITITIGGICLGILIFGFLWIAGLAFVAGCPSYNC